MGSAPTPPNGSFTARVLVCVASIPRGRVMSYGGVAVCAGSRAPRAVGGVLAQYGDEVPWHRVVRADGSLAEHVRIRQRRLLAEEGVPMDGDRVIMEWAEYSGGRRGPRPDRALG